MAIAYVIVFAGFFILYQITRVLLAKTFVKLGMQTVSIKTVNSLSALISAIAIAVPIYMWIQSSTGPTDDLAISNFKFEKCVRVISPAFTDESKKDEDFYAYYSYEIKNNSDNIKKFDLKSYILLDNFNNMGSFKELLSFPSIYDNENKLMKFDDINLFKAGETYKVYGSIELDEEKLGWIKGNIPFVTSIRFNIGGGTADDDLKYTGKDVEHNVDVTSFKDFILKSYNDPSTITLEYHRKNQFSPLTLKNNIWSEKRKRKGHKETDAISSGEILDYLFIEKN